MLFCTYDFHHQIYPDTYPPEVGHDVGYVGLLSDDMLVLFFLQILKFLSSSNPKSPTAYSSLVIRFIIMTTIYKRNDHAEQGV